MKEKQSFVITDLIAAPAEPESQVLDGVAEVVCLDAHDEEELVGHVEDADVLMVYHHLAITAKTLDHLRRCRLIVRGGVGVDNVDIAYARRKEIPVANIPDYGSEEVADSAIGMVLALTRGIAMQNSRLRAGLGPWTYTQATPLQRLRGRVLGIVGLGRIGSAVALRGKALGMDVVFYDPYKPDGYDKALGIRRVEELADLLGQSYALTVHCPLTEQTRGMIGPEAIAAMPAGSYLINTSRGAVVQTAAIPPAIESGQLAGAAIDVLEHEPPPDDDPLVKAWRNPDHPAYHRVLLTPHSAFYCEQGLLEIRQKGAEAGRRAILGLPLRNIVN